MIFLNIVVKKKIVSKLSRRRTFGDFIKYLVYNHDLLT